MLFDPKKIVVLDTVASTNNYAMAMIQQGISVSENAIFAMEQTHGKGRRGKNWISNKGENIILSIPVQMQWLPVSQQFGLSVAVAIAAREFLSKFTLLPVRIKWPNDIFINDSKAGGILIENAIKGRLWQWAVIGIGINVNQAIFPEGYNLKPVSLKQITGQDYDILELAEMLRLLIIEKIEELKSGNFQKMLDEYNDNLFARNQKVNLKKQNIVFETTIMGVSETGQLITNDALERRFDFDEVEFKGLV